jgi:DNA invertase Pin-like site-specific DNA recombinase
MLAVLGGPADVERDLIRTRTAEGRSRAMLKGKHMGQPPSLTPEQQKEATRRRADGATLQELADSYDRSISTMRRPTRAADAEPFGEQLFSLDTAPCTAAFSAYL